MTTARAELVDPDVTRWYHCVIRCVRRAFLLGEGEFDRKQWIEDRLEELSRSFAVSVGAFAVLDNQLHVLARLDPEVAAGWSAEEVVRRWARVLPPRDKTRQPIPVSDEWVRDRRKNASEVALSRQRLGSLSWFMKSLKEPLSRMVNRQEGTRGAFFEGRFKSVSILDDQALIATCAYIDLTPLLAGLTTVPKTGKHTSIKRRAAHAAAQRRAATRKAAKPGKVSGAARVPGVEESLWLCPIEDRRGLDSTREGMIAGVTLGNYLLLAEYTGRFLREEKTTISRELTAVFDRLETDAENWQSQLLMLSEGRLLGRYFAGSRQRLRDVAEQLGMHHLANLGGCPTR